MWSPAIVHVLAVVFVATLIRSAIGFGEALVAVPLLALRIPVQVAAPLAVMLSVAIAALIVVQDWRHIHVRSAGGLVMATLLGIPLGVALLTSGNERAVKGVLAMVIIAFAVYSLRARNRPLVAKDGVTWTLVFGFSAGVLGGAYGMNGPPLAVYGAMRGWSAQHFRATLQGYFLPASLIGLGGFWFAGLVSPLVVHYFLASLPVMLLAIVIGRLVNQRLHGPAFFTVVYIGLVGIGAVLLAQAFIK